LDGAAGLVVVAAVAGHGEAAVALDGGGGATRLVVAAAAGGVVTNALVGTQGEDSIVVGVLHADATLQVLDASTGNTLSVRYAPCAAWSARRSQRFFGAPSHAGPFLSVSFSLARARSRISCDS
jgi:hypothetical protein